MFVPGEDDKKFIRRAIELALLGEGYTDPNPMVGAVIVKDGRIIGEGYHRRYGDLHAERDAIARLKECAQGASMYVTLEPCCHHGKQPPCTEAVIEAGISRVFVGSRDPNPLVAGKGVKILREAGIEVIEDCLREECDAVNPVFFKYITTGRPYVVLKYAMTMDGKIATGSGASKWITGSSSREEVQRLRHKYMAIMAGIGTVLADDPMLNVRIQGLKSPVRIICDSGLRMPPGCNIVRTAGDIRTIAAYCKDEDEVRKRAEALEYAGVNTVKLPGKDGCVDMEALMAYLGRGGINSVLVEGGGTLNDSILRSSLADRVEVFMAPKIFGGANAKTPVEGVGVGTVDEAALFSLESIRRYDDDIRLSYVRRTV